jgi:hypothetical protein
MTLRKYLGYALLGISCIAFGVLPLIPLFPLEAADKVAWAGALFIFAEITWWAAMPLLGPEMVALLNACWSAIKKALGMKSPSPDTTEQQRDTE